jgi:hypothetical protein
MIRKSILLGILTIVLGTVGCAQKTKNDVLKTTITAFALAADQSDTIAFNKLLDNNFRIVMNRAFGSKEVSIVPKAIYLQKIASKEWGGTPRVVTIHAIDQNGTTAYAKVTLKGQKMTFTSLLILIEDVNGNWKVIEDCPVIAK